MPAAAVPVVAMVQECRVALPWHRKRTLCCILDNRPRGTCLKVYTGISLVLRAAADISIKLEKCRRRMNEREADCCLGFMIRA